MVLGQIQGEFWSQNLGNVVEGPRVVIALRVTNRQEVRIPRVGIVDTNGGNPEPRDDSNQRVSNGVPWRDQWAVSISTDLSPIKGNGKQRHASPSTEKLIDNHVVRANPASKAEHTEERSDEAGEPVPAKGAREHDEEVPVA